MHEKQYEFAADVFSISSHIIRSVNDNEADPHSLALTNQCRRICLQAGADPTLHPPDRPGLDLVVTALSVGTTVSLELGHEIYCC